MYVEPVRWIDGNLIIVDQTLLPTQYREVPLKTVSQVWQAIRSLQVRGAPAIGICAAFGVVVALREKAPKTLSGAVGVVREAADYLSTSRPTGANLFWALDRMRRVAEAAGSSGDMETLTRRLEAEAIEICEEDKRRCRSIGEHGAPLIGHNDGVLTHCNAGSLATGGYGTALAVMFRAHELGTIFHVFVGETRPLLQGARLTTWELMQAGIEVTLICDNAVAQVMREGRVQIVLVGADRIASNGDTANKIGTYALATLAKAHTIPFYVAAPFSTFDRSLRTGAEIPVEQRDPREVTHGFGRQIAPDKVRVYSPAFDVTPAHLITGIITEEGILKPPYKDSIAACW